MEAMGVFSAMDSLFSVYMFAVAALRLGLGITLAVLAIKCMLKYLKKDSD